MTTPEPSEPSPFRYVHSENIPELLECPGVSIAITTYQAGKLSTLLRSCGVGEGAKHGGQQLSFWSIPGSLASPPVCGSLWSARAGAPYARSLSR
jgi:hypothetical protein